MKITAKIVGLTFIVMLMFTFAANAQSQRKEIVNELSSAKAGQGKVRVFEDNAVKDVLGRNMAPSRTVYSKGDEQFVRMRGFKIQAFAGNNQRTSKDEANYKQRIISEAFPDHETVILFDSPFWRLRVGNFKSREEANEVMKEMKDAFPSFGKEMYIVVDEIKVSVN